jgi:hypothetical protein
MLATPHVESVEQPWGRPRDQAKATRTMAWCLVLKGGAADRLVSKRPGRPRPARRSRGRSKNSAGSASPRSRRRRWYSSAVIVSPRLPASRRTAMGTGLQREPHNEIRDHS